MQDFLTVYKDIQIVLPDMHLWQCDVSKDRSLRHCGVNDIRRPGIQPQLIHMQIPSLALTLINSLWVHSFPVNKDLAAFEQSSTLSGERHRERALVVNLTVKPPQDIMQPPSCQTNPPRRCRTEPVHGTRKGGQKKSSALVSYSIPPQVLKNPMTELSEWLEIEPVKSCVPSGPYEWEWVMLLYSTACICFSTMSIQYWLLLIAKKQHHQWRFVTLHHL